MKLALLAELNKLQEKSMAQGVALDIAEGKIESYEFIVGEWIGKYNVMAETVEVQKTLFRKKIGRLVRTIVVEGVVIVVLIVLLL